MKDCEHNYWDTVIKTCGFICVCISLIIGGCQFSKTLEKEYKKPFWEAQLKLCQTAVNATARLARSEEKGKVDKKELDTLFNIFYGEASFLMNEESMTLLGDIASFGHRCNEGTYKKEQCKGFLFNAKSLDFSKSCRDMIIRSSDLPLEKLGSSLLRPEL